MANPVAQTLLAIILVAAPVASATAQRTPAANQQAPAAEAPKPLTRAQMAGKQFRDATSLWQNSRPLEAAQMYEALPKRYPASNLVPQALAMAVTYYYAGAEAKATPLITLLKRRFPNNQWTIRAYWRPVEVKCRRDSGEPLDQQIALLEEFLDRYWAQYRFGDAIERLASLLLKAKQIDDLDKLLSHALAEADPKSTGSMINMIQRACGGRKDYENMAKIYGQAARNIDAKTAPAAMAVRLLEISYLRRAGVLDKEAGKDPEKVEAAKKLLQQALKKTEQIQRERPKSEHAAYCALVMKPAILSDQGDAAAAAKALREGLDAFGIFALDSHWDKLAEHEAAAGQYQAAADIMTKLLAATHWPHEQRQYLTKKHAWQMQASDVDGANRTNAELVRAFPNTREALAAELRSAGNLISANRLPEAETALSAIIRAAKPDAYAAAMMSGYVARFAGAAGNDAAKSLREQFIERFPASTRAGALREALGLPVADTPTTQAKALFDEYKSFAQESNVEAARRRIDRLFKEFPSSEHGVLAAVELSDALKAAEKPELAAQLNLQLVENNPYYHYAEQRLRSAADEYVGASLPAEAMKAYQKLVDRFRQSVNWQRYYVNAAAGNLDAQGRLSEAQALVERVAGTLGNGPEATSVRAYMVRRLETQEKWQEAADGMLRLLGANAANPAYRPLTSRALRFLVVAGGKDPEYKKKEAKLLEDLATRYEGWDEADRIRLSLSGTYARAGDGARAVKLIKDIQKRHPKYELGAGGRWQVQHLSKYSRGYFDGTVGFHPVLRVGNDMSGGWGNYLYAHTAEDMIDYALLLTQPPAYVDRMRKQLGRLIKSKPSRPRNYKSGIPYRTKNVPRPRWHPWPEQRKVYHMVSRINEGLHRLEPVQRIDAALWLEVYPLWPHYYMNDERIRAAAATCIGRGDKAGSQKALGILNKEYNNQVWEPYILYAQASYYRHASSSSKAIGLYRTVATKYRDHELAARSAQAVTDMGGR